MEVGEGLSRTVGGDEEVPMVFRRKLRVLQMKMRVCLNLKHFLNIFMGTIINSITNSMLLGEYLILTNKFISPNY